jgi:SNF2 family DNA or RNA helicase
MKYKTKPYKHQTTCLKKFGNSTYFALLADMGTGKTWIIINNLAKLYEAKKCDAALVFAPNGVHANWARLELPRHMPIDYEAAVWTAGPNKKEKAEIENIFDSNNDCCRIFLVNWEALQNNKGFNAALRFAESAKKLMIVCDESDAVKNPSAKRTKNLMKLKKHAYWRRIMTGTPITNSPFDAFSQFYFLDSSILGTSFYAFKAEYAELLPASNALVQTIMKKSRMRGAPQIVAKGAGGRPKYRNLDKLSRLMAPHSFRVTKDECLDLPDKNYKTMFFDLTDEQRAVYKKAEKECRLVFEEEETPFNKLVATMKLAQITSGYYIHPMSEEPVRIDGDNPKLDMMMEQINKIVESGHQIIIWARYRIEIADIVRRLQKMEIDCVQYHGGVKKKARITAIDDFENGHVPVFVGNQQAGGRGLTLVAANYVTYFSNSFSLRDRLQSEDRAHRIGQTKNVTYINIAGKGTIDEVVIKALLAKKNVADVIIDQGLKLFS